MTPELLVNLIRSDPFAWLWDTRVQRELFALLGPLWERASETERIGLIDTILNGFPDDRFKDEVERAERDRLSDHSVWERLARLRRDGAELPEHALSRLEDIEEQHPEWRLTGAPSEDFSWSETGYGYPTDTDADTLRGLAESAAFEELFDVLTEGTPHSPHREGRQRTWEGVVTTNPELASPFLRWMEASGRWDKGVLMWTFQPLGADPSRLSTEDWGEALTLTPSGGWGAALHPVCRGVGALVAQTEEEGLPDSLALWDTALNLALDYGETIEEEGDLLNASINEPVGHLSEGVLDLARRYVELEDSVPASVLERIETLLETANEAGPRPGGVAARVPVYARHHMLSLVENDWVAHNVVPRLNWEQPREARIAWEGLLWVPHIRPELWDAVVPHALDACAHYEEIGRGKSDLAVLLVTHYLWGAKPSSTELKLALRGVDDHARRGAARYTSELLAGADAKADELWRSRVRRLFAEAWPMEIEYRSDDLSAELVLLATRTDEAMPDASEVLGGLIGPTPSLWMALGQMIERDIASRYPQPVVDLLAKVVHRNRTSELDRLQRVLERAEGGGAVIPPWLTEVAARR